MAAGLDRRWILSRGAKESNSFTTKYTKITKKEELVDFLATASGTLCALRVFVVQSIHSLRLCVSFLERLMALARRCCISAFTLPSASEKQHKIRSPGGQKTLWNSQRIPASFNPR